MAAPMTERDGALTAGTPQKHFAIRTEPRGQSAAQHRSGGSWAEVSGQHDRRRQRQRPARSDARLDGGVEEVNSQDDS